MLLYFVAVVVVVASVVTTALFFAMDHAVVVVLSGCGGRNYDYCGATKHTKPYCRQNYAKPDYVHQAFGSALQP